MSDEQVINSKMSLDRVEKKVKFYQTYLFKLVTSSVAIFSVVLPTLYYANDFIVKRSIKDATKNIRDSLQDEAIREKGESIGECYKYIDKTNEKVNVMEQGQEMEKSKNDNLRSTLIFYFNKVDKSMNLLLQRNAEIRKVNLFDKKNTYSDSLSAYNTPHKDIEMMCKPYIREADYFDDLGGVNEIVKPCKPNNPLKYFIFINQ